MPKRKDQRKKFTIEETVRALALWSSRRYQDQFSSADTPNKIFENLSLEMKASGFDRSSYELRKLVQNLTLKYYKKIADRTGTKLPKTNRTSYELATDTNTIFQAAIGHFSDFFIKSISRQHRIVQSEN